MSVNSQQLAVNILYLVSRLLVSRNCFNQYFKEPKLTAKG
jgi:hypothetical protein